MQYTLFEKTSNIRPVVCDLKGPVDRDALASQLQSIPLNDGQLHYLPQWLSSDISAELMGLFKNSLAWEQSTLKMYGKSVPIPRLNAWYGDAGAHYQYSGLSLSPLEWTQALSRLRGLLQQTVNIVLEHTETQVVFNSVLANYYRDGQDGVAWHSDDERELGREPLIASVSLGETRSFLMKHKTKLDQKYQLPLMAGSVLVMSGKTQHCWLHSIPKTTKRLGSRINLTYRYVGVSGVIV